MKDKLNAIVVSLQSTNKLISSMSDITANSTISNKRNNSNKNNNNNSSKNDNRKRNDSSSSSSSGGDDSSGDSVSLSSIVSSKQSGEGRIKR